MTSPSAQISLKGGFPWGFRLHESGFGIQVQRVRPDGKACAAGLREGDVVSSINGQDCALLSLKDVNYLIDQCFDLLRLEVRRDVHEASAGAFNSPYKSSNLTECAQITGSNSNGNPRKSLQRRLLPGVCKAGSEVRESERINMLSYLVRSGLPTRGGRAKANLQPASGLVRAQEPNVVRTPRRLGYCSDVEDWQRTELRVPAKQRPCGISVPLASLRSSSRAQTGAEQLHSQPKQTFHVLRRSSLNIGPLNTPEPSKRIANTGPKYRETSYCYGPRDRNTAANAEQDQALGQSLRSVTKSPYAALSRGGYPNQYPTIEERKSIARHIASVLEKGFAVPASRQFGRFYCDAGVPTPLAVKATSNQFSNATNFTSNVFAAPVINYGPGRMANMDRRGGANSPLATTASSVDGRYLRSLDNSDFAHLPQFRNRCDNGGESARYAVSPSLASDYVESRLASGLDRGTQLFQRRKARCDRWIVEGKKSARMAYHSDTEALNRMQDITRNRFQCGTPANVRAEGYTNIAQRN